MSTYLLIHGAWHGGWCWRKVVQLLEADGDKALAPDLPGHGDDKTAPALVTLKSYADRVCDIASSQTEPVILVGHSMGGIVITQAAENCPSSVRALVYLCAYLPRNGDTLITWASQDRESIVNPMTVELRSDGVAVVKREYIREAFYGNCAEEEAAWAQSHLVEQSASPFGEQVKTTAKRWGRIPRYYIESERDRAVSLTIQREMQKNSPCKQTFSIDTDHSPFLSTPEHLAKILLQIGSRNLPTS